MSDGTEDLAAQELVVRAHPKLKALKPDHELLKYIVIENGEVRLVAHHVAEFKERFGKPGIPPERRRGYHWIAYTLGVYSLALEEACLDPEKPIVVRHGHATPPPATPTTVYGTGPMWDEADDFPF